MQKRALIIGINYLNNSQYRLYGCINDAKELQTLLTDVANYHKDEILLLTDETPLKPTKDVITQCLHELAAMSYSKQLTHVFISFAGHGSTIADENGDEADNRDEVIYPLDFEINGPIIDDDFAKILRKFNPDTNIVIVIDSCHSGTFGDMPYQFVSGNKSFKIFPTTDSEKLPNIIILSACQDHEQDAEVYDETNKRISGALTHSLITVLKDNDYELSCFKTLKYIHEFLKSKGYSQVPKLNSSKEIHSTDILMSKRTLVNLI